MLGAGSLLILAMAWLAVSGILAYRQLQAARTDEQALRADISTGHLAAATVDARALRRHADAARDWAGGPVWAVAAATPGAGPVHSAHDIVRTVAALADTAVPSLIDARTDTIAGALRRPNGSIDTVRLTRAGVELDAASTSVAAARQRIDALPTHTWLGAVDRARAELSQDLGVLAPQVDSAARTVRIAGPLLGARGTQRFFVAFQNEAESRGTGGLPGQFAILQIDHGVPRFTRFGNDGTLDGVHADVPTAADYASLYAPDRPTALYVNANVSPDFPSAARIWVSMWARYSGQRLDGAIAVDPTALGYLLGVTGPATVPSAPASAATSVSATNIVQLTESDAYRRFGTDRAARRTYLTRIAQAVAARVLSYHGSSTPLLSAASRAAGERRLLVWSADPAIEAEIEPTEVSGAVEQTAQPYVGLSIVNDGGDKLDYYLDRTLSWQRSGCGPQRSVVVTIRLTNSAPAGLPAAVTQRSDVHSYPVKAGDSRLDVSYLATQGARIDTVTIDGALTTTTNGYENGHPVAVVDVELPRATTRIITLHISEPAAPGVAVVLSPPSIRPLTTSIRSQSCP